MFVVVIGFIGLNANVNPLNTIPLKCVSMNNQECKRRPAKWILTIMSYYFILTVFL